MLASRSPRTHVVFPCSPQPPAYHILSTFAPSRALRERPRRPGPCFISCERDSAPSPPCSPCASPRAALDG